MTALLILLAGALWAAVLFFAAYWLTFFIPKKWVRVVIGFVTVPALFTLPMRDEIKGAEEFEALCKVGGIYQISPNAVGKKFDLRFSATDYKALRGYTRPIEEATISYTDVQTGEVVATAKAYVAKGGWLVQQGLLRNSGGGDGALWGRAQCLPSEAEGYRLSAVANKFVQRKREKE